MIYLVICQHQSMKCQSSGDVRVTKCVTHSRGLKFVVVLMEQILENCMVRSVV